MQPRIQEPWHSTKINPLRNSIQYVLILKPIYLFKYKVLYISFYKFTMLKFEKEKKEMQFPSSLMA